MHCILFIVFYELYSMYPRGMIGASVVKSTNRVEVVDRVEGLTVRKLNKEEEDGELLGMVKAACLEARGRLGLTIIQPTQS
jgi:hypothetical protein